MHNKNYRNQMQEHLSSRAYKPPQPRELSGQDDSLARTLRKNKTQYFESLVRLGEHNQIDEEGADQDFSAVGQTQMEKLSEVVKNLVIKNKLNSRNAFEVPLIDVNSLGAIKNNDEGAWNKISNVLENSAKVYGFRVDFMVEGINKMTNNMARSEKTQQMDILHKNKSNNIGSASTVDNSVGNSEYYSNEPTWNDEIYTKHLETDKINHNSTQVCQDACHSSIRRLFDQNGVAGLLMGRLPITSSLNIVIDPTIEYPSVSLPITHAVPSICKLSGQGSFDMLVAEEIKMLKDFCFREHQDQFHQTEVVMEDCYNLLFDQQPENFRWDSHEQLNENLMKSIPEEHELIQQPIELVTSFKLDKINFRGNDDSITPQTLTHCSLPQPLLNLNFNKEKNRKKNKKQRVRKEKVKRSEKQEINIDFSGGFQDRSAVLSASGSIGKKEKKLRDKHMLDKIVPDFIIQQQTNYQPILPQCLTNYPQNDENKKLKLENQISQPLSQNYFQIMTQMGSSMSFLAPNIKDTKVFLWDLIKNENHVRLSNLQQIYQKQRGNISEPLLFLAVLHLGNEYNLSINEGPNFQIEIYNNAVFI